MADEITNSQPSQDGDLASDNEQTLETSPEESSEELSGIPDKFKDKDPMEIIKSYTNLEKQMSKISSERASEKKTREDLELRQRQMETTIQVLQEQLSRPAQRQVMESESDPLSDYEKAFEEDPKKAIRDLALASQRAAERKAERIAMEVESRQVQEYHNQQKQENPDYVKHLPKMQSLAQEFGDLVKPEKSNSLKALKLLHLAARGASVDDYVSEAISRAKKEGNAVRDEKKKAFSESSQSTGDGKKVDFSQMSSADMAKHLPRAD